MIFEEPKASLVPKLLFVGPTHSRTRQKHAQASPQFRVVIIHMICHLSIFFCISAYTTSTSQSDLSEFALKKLA